MKKTLSLFDVTNITVGSIIGADIYVASAITAGLIGPFALVVWVVAGFMAIVLALVFAYCSHQVPKVGGPFAYVSEAFNDFLGFLAGWSLWIAEIIAIPVFAIAFVNYLQYFVHLNYWEQLLIKGAFILMLTGINIVGVKAAGVANDVLTVLKLAPLVLLMVAGLVFFVVHPSTIQHNYSPFITHGLENFSTAIVLIFWAYVGFELATIPASEVRDPRRTIPRGIIIGILIVVLFYLLTNFVVYGAVNWKDLAGSTRPLSQAGAVLLGSVGAVIMSVGALLSVAGSDESDILGSARLSYAMAAEGLLPKFFSKVHPKFGTPYIALVAQGVVGFGLSVYSAIPNLISFSVFNLSFAFLLTCLALLVLTRKNRGRGAHIQRGVAVLGCLICLYLLYSTTLTDKLAGLLVLAVGAVIYAILSPKVSLSDIKGILSSEEHHLLRALERERRFLGNALRLGRRLRP